MTQGYSTATDGDLVMQLMVLKIQTHAQNIEHKNMKIKLLYPCTHIHSFQALALNLCGLNKMFSMCFYNHSTLYQVGVGIHASGV